MSGNICWSAYARFVEIAETEFFRALGFPYATLWDQLDIWLPRVQAHFDYRSPVRLDELLEIDVWVGRVGRSSIRLEGPASTSERTAAVRLSPPQVAVAGAYDLASKRL